MQEQKSIFQIVILGVFGFAVVMAVFVFAGLTGGSESTDSGPVILWGTVDDALMDSYLTFLNEIDGRAGNITYEEIPADIYQRELLEALASGQGPDLFMVTDADVMRHWDKIAPVPIENLSERAFKDTYIDAAEVFMVPSGARALPLSADPLVLFWNRDMFARAGFSRPPQYWDELFLIAEKMTKRNSANTIEQSAIAFGEFDNVTHAKDIIAALIMQAGGDIVFIAEDGSINSGLAPQGLGSTIAPAQSALRFYTEFADPTKNVYSWNLALPQSIDAFAQARLGMYVGYASDVALIRAKNAHLNFDVAPLPQIKSGEQRRILTFARMHALAIPRVAANPNGAYQMAQLMTSAVGAPLYTQATGLPSVRRDLLAERPADPLAAVFRDSVLVGKVWFDPHAERTAEIFRRMITGVTSGELRPSDTVFRANEELRALLRE